MSTFKIAALVFALFFGALLVMYDFDVGMAAAALVVGTVLFVGGFISGVFG